MQGLGFRAFENGVSNSAPPSGDIGGLQGYLEFGHQVFAVSDPSWILQEGTPNSGSPHT